MQRFGPEVWTKMAGYGLETHDIVKNREIISCIKRGSLILVPGFPISPPVRPSTTVSSSSFVHWFSLFSPRSSPFIYPNNSRELKEMEFCLLWESNPRSKPNSRNIESANNFGENHRLRLARWFSPKLFALSIFRASWAMVHMAMATG